MKMLNIFHTCKEKFKDEYAKDKIFFSKLATIVIMQVNMEVLQIANVI